MFSNSRGIQYSLQKCKELDALIGEKFRLHRVVPRKEEDDPMYNKTVLASGTPFSSSFTAVYRGHYRTSAFKAAGQGWRLFAS